MSRAKRRDAWDHTANLLALLINVNRDPSRGSPMTAEKLHPYLDELEPLSVEEQNAMLKEQFAMVRDRTFGGKVTKIKRFIPVNAESVSHAEPRSS